jgi:hypothetical protein
MSSISRIDKLFADRDNMFPAVAHTRRQGFSVEVLCGDDVANSYTLQLAAITAASIASRCFPGAVAVRLSDALLKTPCLVWPSMNLTLEQAFSVTVGRHALAVGNPGAARSLIFGQSQSNKNAMRVTFDGWIVRVGPATQVERLNEREYCPLVACLAAALVISEVFLSFADISIEAGRRPVTMSLWTPGRLAEDAIGVPIENLPQSLWALGLGHLGNAYLWALAGLPYTDPKAVKVFLNDFDKVEAENVETGLLFSHDDVDTLKTRVCSDWLAKRGFESRLVERHFDGNFRRREDEPGLALCGFDSNPVRRDLSTANFARVVESGLGGTSNNFDTVSLHTLPNPRHPDELWPDLSSEDLARGQYERKRMARENAAYLALDHDECGRIGLTGKSVAVPFVGTAAASFVLAEALRLLHGGPAYSDIKFKLSVPDCISTIGGDHYKPSAFAGLDYTAVAKAWSGK